MYSWCLYFLIFQLCCKKFIFIRAKHTHTWASPKFLPPTSISSSSEEPISTLLANFKLFMSVFSSYLYIPAWFFLDSVLTFFYERWKCSFLSSLSPSTSCIQAFSRPVCFSLCVCPIYWRCWKTSVRDSLSTESVLTVSSAEPGDTLWFLCPEFTTLFSLEKIILVSVCFLNIH